MKKIICIVIIFVIVLASSLFFIFRKNKSSELEKVTVADTTLTSRIYMT